MKIVTVGAHQAALHEEGLAIEGRLGLLEDLLLLLLAGQSVERNLWLSLATLLRRLQSKRKRTPSAHTKAPFIHEFQEKNAIELGSRPVQQRQQREAKITMVDRSE